MNSASSHPTRVARFVEAAARTDERGKVGVAEMIVRNIGHRGRSRSWCALRSGKRHGVADLHLYKLDEPLVVAWRRVLAIEVIDDLGQVAGQPLSRSASVTPRPHNKARAPSQTLGKCNETKWRFSAPRQRKPLESHDLGTTARVHHTGRRRGGRVAGSGAWAEGGACVLSAR